MRNPLEAALEAEVNCWRELLKKVYGSIDELQVDLDQWVDRYNNERPHQDKMCCGRTPMQTLIDGKKIYKDKHYGFQPENHNQKEPPLNEFVKGEAKPNLRSPLQRREDEVVKQHSI